MSPSFMSGQNRKHQINSMVLLCLCSGQNSLLYHNWKSDSLFSHMSLCLKRMWKKWSWVKQEGRIIVVTPRMWSCSPTYSRLKVGNFDSCGFSTEGYLMFCTCCAPWQVGQLYSDLHLTLRRELFIAVVSLQRGTWSSAPTAGGEDS